MNIQQKFVEYPKGPKEKSKTTRLKKLNTNLDINGDINNKTAATIITIYDNNNNNNNNDSNALGNTKYEITPQNLSTSQFDNIQLLPTPIHYFPLSPIQGLDILGDTSPTLSYKNSIFQQQLQQSSSTSTTFTNPTLSKINIKKRHEEYTALKNVDLNEINCSNKQNKESNNLDELSKIEHRIVSELVPAPYLSLKRISSVPTVGEELSGISQFSTGNDIDDGTDNDYTDAEIGSNIDNLNVYLLPNLDHSIKLNKIKQIGKGNFSVVDLYENIEPDPSKDTSKLVAIKKIVYPDNLFGQINNNSASSGNYDIELFSSFESSLIRELSVLQKLDHPCTIKFYGINNPIFLDDKTPLSTLLRQSKKKGNNENNNTNGLDTIIPECNMVMSYCEGGDLLSALTECNGGLEIELVQRIFTEISLAVKYLHDNLIVHRDLKLENILLVYPLNEIKLMTNNESKREFYLKNNIIQLTDFGLCKQLSRDDDLCVTRCGSEDYIAPEVLMGLPYDGRLSDSWAMGVILYSLLEDRLPFDPPINATLKQRRRTTLHRIAGFEWRWNKLKDSNMYAKEIVSNTLTSKNKRWDINNIMESKFVSDLVKQLTFI